MNRRPGDARSRNLRGVAVLFSSFFCAFLFFYPVLLLSKTFFFRDIHRLFYPMKFFLSHSLKSGSIAFWCSDYFCGAPFLSDIQSGVFYPLSLIFPLLPFPWALNVYVVVHFVLAFLFFYLFIRQLGPGFGAALLTAISYCYGSYIISSVNVLNNLSTAIWLPALLWSFGRYCILRTGPSFLLATLIFAAALLGGEPQLLFLMTVLTAFCCWFVSPDGDHSLKGSLGRGTMLCAVVMFALLITSMQLIPTFNDYMLSVRQSGISFDEATRSSLAPGMLKHLFAPLTFHDRFVDDPSVLANFFPSGGGVPWLLTIYPGLIITLAAASTLFRISRPILFWLIAFLASTVFALGNNTPAFHLFYAVFPYFRFPEKFMFTASFSLLILAAYGLDSVFGFVGKKGIRSVFLVLPLALILLADLYGNHHGLNPVCDSSFCRMNDTSLRPILNDRDLFRVYVDSDSPSERSAATMAAVHLRWQRLLMPNLGMLFGLSHVDGQSGMELRYQYFITELLSFPWKERIRFLKLANVKYIISTKPLDEVPELMGEVEKVNDIVYRIRNPMPRAWIVGRLRPVRAGTIDELVDGSVDFTTTAITRGRIIERHTGAFFKEAPRPAYENAKIRIDVSTDESSILVLSESAYPGWKVWMDGKEVDCLWLNLLFNGVELTPGRHKIEFVFRPKSFSVSLAVAASVSIMLLLVCLFPAFWKKRKERR